MKEKRFNVRVYGICEHNNSFLITDEIICSKRMTKFVGGGLEWGEGLEDAVIREFQEECQAEITVQSHFYTTDFFQQSAFRVTDQLISIYYRVELVSHQKVYTVSQPFEGLVDSGQVFRWIPKEELRKEDFTFPIDQKVVELLLG